MRQQQLMRDGAQEEDDNDHFQNNRMDDDDEGDLNAKGGALVEEAKRLMNEDAGEEQTQ